MDLHKKAIKELIKQLCENCENGVDAGCHCKEDESCAQVFAANEVLESHIVVVSSQHAFSLIKMIAWFKDLIECADLPAMTSRSDELTTAYCDELLEDLKQ